MLETILIRGGDEIRKIQQIVFKNCIKKILNYYLKDRYETAWKFNFLIYYPVDGREMLLFFEYLFSFYLKTVFLYYVNF